MNFLRRIALQENKPWWQLASRCCWNHARPWHASELVSFLVGLRTYQHPSISASRLAITLTQLSELNNTCDVLSELIDRCIHKNVYSLPASRQLEQYPWGVRYSSAFEQSRPTQATTLRLRYIVTAVSWEARRSSTWQYPRQTLDLLIKKLRTWRTEEGH